MEPSNDDRKYDYSAEPLLAASYRVINDHLVSNGAATELAEAIHRLMEATLLELQVDVLPAVPPDQMLAATLLLELLNNILHSSTPLHPTIAATCVMLLGACPKSPLPDAGDYVTVGLTPFLEVELQQEPGAKPLLEQVEHGAKMSPVSTRNIAAALVPQEEGNSPGPIANDEYPVDVPENNW